MFITFEGIEGSGKSTQRQLLLDWLKTQDISYVATREPGGTNIGQTFRELLLSNDSLISEYLDLQEQYQKKWGEKTIVLMEVGSFFEIYGVLLGTYNSPLI